ncbi:hypothetical protein ACIGMX_34675 [Streptomyces aquilus]|uniref:hypothetical protein n=1 Tax=Streptomyces aquilus TaxID=2548456 RepID=UPI0037D7814B
MSQSNQLARTGTAAGAIVVGGVAFTGWYLLALALAVVILGAVLVRVAFRPGLAASEASPNTHTTATAPDRS